MPIHIHGDWCYDYNVSPHAGKFYWHVVRFKIDPHRSAQVTGGSWIAGGIAVKRDEAEHEGLAAIKRDVASRGAGNAS